LHLGHILGPLISYSLAQSQKGEFILRIEDTDSKRNQQDSADNIIRDLKWLGVDYNKGPEIGQKNEYFQSERLDLYRKYVDQLLAEGKAYKAYETPEERELQIVEQRKKGQLPIYMGGHADLTDEQRAAYEAEGRQPVVRLKVPRNELIEFDDYVYGHVKINTNAIGDFVIQRSNTYPMYNLAVVVDDHLMNVTDVIRGFDHLNNTPKQILIYRALGWDTPRFGHHSSLLSEDGNGKLSKRKGAKPIAKYRAEGYMPDAIFNYIMLNTCSFTFSSKEEEIMTREQIFSKISADKVLKTNSRFNPQKLDWINGQHIRLLTVDQFEAKVIEWLEAHARSLTKFDESFDDSIVDSFLANQDILKKALPLIHIRIDKFIDVLTQLKFLVVAPDPKSIDVTPSKHTKDELNEALKQLAESLDKVAYPWVQVEWEAAIRELADKLGWKHGDLFMALRLAVVGDRFSPPLLESLNILGKDECIARIMALQA
jgi:nondiscriminating glutamyl-tRNA synthetase